MIGEAAGKFAGKRRQKRHRRASGRNTEKMRRAFGEERAEMAGEKDLAKLLGGMDPRLHEEIYVFATVPPDESLPCSLQPTMVFREAEGLTAIIPEAEAQDAGIDGIFRCRMITLEIHSSLEAVGFLAAVTAKLAAAGMGVNPVSAFHHDHLFVPADRAQEAFALLQALAAENG
jgi:hypothetical protein